VQEQQDEISRPVLIMWKIPWPVLAHVEKIPHTLLLDLVTQVESQSMCMKEACNSQNVHAHLAHAVLPK
jgi:hypothetical protein